jgi:CDP-6-deoxy-D-xylo-4-hexulose-3-dehydrase
MNLESQQSLAAWLDHNLVTPTAAGGKYWYPLTLSTYGKEEVAAAVECMLDYRTSMGALTREFEQKFAEYVGAQNAVMVNSGSSADLLLAFQLVNPLQPRLQLGDEVLVPAVTWPTQVWSLLMAGLKVQLVDVDPRTLNIDFDDLRRRITPRTKCLFAVHLMGNPCDMAQLTQICDEHELLLIEDCCESLGVDDAGRHVGTFGLGGTFSFFFSHHMTTMEGGMVVCNSDEEANSLRVLRSHGWSRGLPKTAAGGAASVDERFQFINWGFNVRPTELQAAFGLQQLPKLDGMNKRRNQLAARYADFVESCPHVRAIEVPESGTACPLALVVQLAGRATAHRGELLEILEQAGVETRPVVTGNIARQPAAALLGALDPADYPGAEVVHHESFYVGLNPMFDDVMFQRMLQTLDVSLTRVAGSTPLKKVG